VKGSRAGPSAYRKDGPTGSKSQQIMTGSRRRLNVDRTRFEKAAPAPPAFDTTERAEAE